MRRFEVQGSRFKVIGAAIITACIVVMLTGCSFTVKEAQKIDASMASYLGVEKLSLDCKAGIARADMDLSADPVSVRRIEAITKYADENSEDYKQCYSSIAWLNYVGVKIEGAFKKGLQKLVELGVIVP